jgi:hypothetical protein
MTSNSNNAPMPTANEGTCDSDEANFCPVASLTKKHASNSSTDHGGRRKSRSVTIFQLARDGLGGIPVLG